jgi:hypothetical protein
MPVGSGERGLAIKLAIAPPCDEHVACWRRQGVPHTVKTIAEYLEHALQFERLAAEVSDAKFKADLENQAKAYRKLATGRANKLGLSPPSAQKDAGTIG